MGSTGSGRFSDYPPTGAQESGSGAQRDDEGGSNGGGSSNECLSEIEDVALEEVERCPYFGQHGDVPPVGTDVEVLAQLVSGRIGVATQADGELVGYMPTRFNYLLSCLKEGHRYPGEVSASSSQPTAVVRVTLEPT